MKRRIEVEGQPEYQNSLTAWVTSKKEFPDLLICVLSANRFCHTQEMVMRRSTKSYSGGETVALPKGKQVGHGSE